jgi:hypothetical protein
MNKIVKGRRAVSADTAVPPVGADRCRKEARRRRVGYRTLINEVLAEHTRKDVA